MTMTEAEARVEATEAAEGGRLSGALERLAERVGARASVHAVFGEPIEQGEIIVVPVARVRWGVGVGGGTGGERGTGAGSGGGGGAAAAPLGQLEMPPRRAANEAPARVPAAAGEHPPIQSATWRSDRAGRRSNRSGRRTRVPLPVWRQASLLRWSCGRSLPGSAADGAPGMTTEVAAAVLLILVPIAFNAAFFELGRAFDYPDILRKEPDEILRRFAAGGPGLILRWEGLLISALLMLPVGVMLAVVLAGSPALSVLSVTVGTTAAIVQGLGLVRWPFAVPEMARRYVAAPDGPDGEATRQGVVVVFATLHRLLGVGIGEHLGYLFTGLWTLLASASILSTSVLPAWLGVIGVLIAL